MDIQTNRYITYTNQLGKHAVCYQMPISVQVCTCQIIYIDIQILGDFNDCYHIFRIKDTKQESYCLAGEIFISHKALGHKR